MSREIKTFPNTFERPIKRLTQDRGGFEVEFECGHTVWFAIRPDTNYAYNCSLRFEEYRLRVSS